MCLFNHGRSLRLRCLASLPPCRVNANSTVQSLEKHFVDVVTKSLPCHCIFARGVFIQKKAHTVLRFVDAADAPEEVLVVECTLL